MSTVLVARFVVVCLGCGMRSAFLIGGSMGTIYAVKKGGEIHARQQPACKWTPTVKPLKVRSSR